MEEEVKIPVKRVIKVVKTVSPQTPADATKATVGVAPSDEPYNPENDMEISKIPDLDKDDTSITQTKEEGKEEVKEEVVEKSSSGLATEPKQGWPTKPLDASTPIATSTPMPLKADTPIVPTTPAPVPAPAPAPVPALAPMATPAPAPVSPSISGTPPPLSPSPKEQPAVKPLNIQRTIPSLNANKKIQAIPPIPTVSASSLNQGSASPQATVQSATSPSLVNTSVQQPSTNNFPVPQMENNHQFTEVHNNFAASDLDINKLEKDKENAQFDSRKIDSNKLSFFSDTDNFAEKLHLPAKFLSTKFMTIIIGGAFFLGFLLGVFLLGGGSSSEQPSQFTIGYIVVNPEIVADRPRCGAAEQSQGCVLYIQNNHNRELEAKDFYPLVMQLTGLQRFQVETGNMRYAHKSIKPGWIAQFNIPPNRK